MGKIVKHCTACDESFAEKFGFCPICGEPLEAFEMSPVKESPTAGSIPDESATVLRRPSKPAVAASAETKDESETVLRNRVKPEVAAVEAAVEEARDAFEPAAEDEVELELDSAEDARQAVPPAANNGQPPLVYDDFKTYFANRTESYGPREDFHVTVLTEKNVKQRNLLLLGSMLLMLSLSLGVVIASIFNHPLLVGAIGDEDLAAFVPIVEEVPMTVEEEQQKANDKDAGGGGGGGRDEQTPTSQGRLATQTPNPLISPDKSIVQKDFELKQPIASTQGTKEIEQTPEPYGDPSSKYRLPSNGTGTGGGQGSGVGTGQGSGIGTGQGSGIGSGSGSGVGSGNGPGTGSGNNGDRDPRPATSGPTKKVTFLSKPQPRYTDAARINNIQGNVTLRITFLANGQIGGIQPVKGLPHGLTEQAIAAARQIRFEPAMRNGQPQSVTMSVQYTFTIY